MRNDMRDLGLSLGHTEKVINGNMTAKATIFHRDETFTGVRLFSCQKIWSSQKHYDCLEDINDRCLPPLFPIRLLRAPNISFGIPLIIEDYNHRMPLIKFELCYTVVHYCPKSTSSKSFLSG